ncbi:hypothetical protein E3N88_38963 [Mikania micrantha]|uniref:Zinc finger, CCHC-type n=1 Tax=Mikania micrantha TaxID=192012 RepID=A0A5N6LVG2_9ASTR|nr:hypothetical protein E3N88_38963 [Mikania micrantha]
MEDTHVSLLLARKEMHGCEHCDLVDDFATKLTGLASKARSLGHDIEEEELVRRLLDAMPKSFLQIVASIEQCFELDSMLFDEVVGRLKAYEERIKGTEKMEDTHRSLLLARKEMHGCEHCGGGSSNRDGFGCGRGRGGKADHQDAREKDKWKCGVQMVELG